MNSRFNITELALCSKAGTKCAVFNLRKAARAVSQFYDSALQNSGLRNTQFSLLMAISSYGPLTVNDLADNMVMDQTTVSRNVRILQKQGYIEMVPGRDMRTRPLSITTKGQIVLKTALPLWKAAQDHMTKKLGNKGMNVLLERLQMATKVARQV
jgi:DNA-binding MarR family transcriptional regulator